MEMTKIDERLDFGKRVSNLADINEETYDDVDQYFSNVKVGFEEEFRRFLVLLIKTYGKQFKWSFATPSSQLFGKSWYELWRKYQVMDDAGKEDLYIRMGSYFRNFFLSQFPYAGETTAVAVAEMFKNMMVERLRDTQIQARKV